MCGDKLTETLSEFIDFIKYKIENHKFTLKELEAMHEFLLENLDVHSTIEDLAAYYNKDEARIRTEISRKVISKPVRRVYYRFSDINKAVPSSWKHHANI